ncbi:MAG: hypothetical protein H0U55_07035 [Rubrobacteraceae bacterium]|nr:hypothetical protein [Rubrobacteraceae bacterium]
MGDRHDHAREGSDRPPGLPAVCALAEAALHGGDIEGVGVAWVHQDRPHDPRFVAQRLPAFAYVRAPVDAMVNHVGVEGVGVLGVHAEPVHVRGGQARVVLIEGLAAVLRAVEAVVTAHVHLRRVLRIDDPAHGVRTLYPGRLGPDPPTVVADGAALVPADHDSIGVRGVHG